MDPHLHRLVERVQNQGICKLKTASTDEDWITVIARIKDLDAFRALADVQIGAVIPPVPADHKGRQSKRREQNDDDDTIVTARMPVKVIEHVRSQPFVLSLKAGQRIRPMLEDVRREVQADVERERTESGDEISGAAGPPEGNGGEGIIIGIIDFGLDFMHKNFRGKDGASRILALWDQAAPADPRYMQPFGYGRLYTQADIDAAIKVSDQVEERSDPEKICVAAYEALGYEPPADSLFQIGAHGTYVTDVAAGNGRGTGIPGLAPKAGIVFVEVSTRPGAPVLGQSFGDSVQLLEAIRFIFDYAGDLPCVINLSLGTNGGPHDGTTLVEQAIDRLLSDPAKPDRAVVIAAGNAFGQNLHMHGRVTHGGMVELKWFIPENDPSPNELEIWYSKDDRFTAEVVDPQGNTLARVAPGWQVDISDERRGFMTIVNRLDDPNNHDNTINIFFESGLQSGEWRLRIHGAVVKRGEFHAWIERDEAGQTRFIGEKRVPDSDERYGAWIDDGCTLGSIACGKKSIVVGSFDARKQASAEDPAARKQVFSLSRNGSAGPTRDNREKPDLAAPGELVMAARSRTLILRNRISGTSISAGVVTGIVALMMARAGENKIHLAPEEISDILKRTAIEDILKPDGRTLDENRRVRLGHGRISAIAALNQLALRVKAK